MSTSIADRVREGDAALLKAKLLADDEWVKRALLALYARQTSEERCKERTVEDNGHGFNGADAQILSSFAVQLQKRGWLSQKQLQIARRRLLKYARQLIAIARGEL